MSRKNYPLRVARHALGIRAQEWRTLVGKAWWARRWIAAVEAYRLGARMGRGRKYALTGQITALSWQGPHVEALVQGSRAAPYRVTFDFATPSEERRARLTQQFLCAPVVLARLLTDDLPLAVEEAFCREGCALFPDAAKKAPFDITMSCSCPDWMRPCKHMAAVLFLLGEEVARRPATLLTLRGIDLDALLPEEKLPADESAGETLLWEDPPQDGTCLGAANDAAALVTRLGAVPFWRGVNPCLKTLSRMYQRAQGVAAAVAEGQALEQADF